MRRHADAVAGDPQFRAVEVQWDVSEAQGAEVAGASMTTPPPSAPYQDTVR